LAIIETSAGMVDIAVAPLTTEPRSRALIPP
jgi:hypothetical protein